jgi:hypothetical protein
MMQRWLTLEEFGIIPEVASSEYVETCMLQHFFGWQLIRII